MSWLGTLRPTTVDDAWAPAIWQTFFTSTFGLEVPVLSSLLWWRLREHGPARRRRCRGNSARAHDLGGVDDDGAREHVLPQASCRPQGSPGSGPGQLELPRPRLLERQFRAKTQGFSLTYTQIGR